MPIILCGGLRLLTGERPPRTIEAAEAEAD